MTRLRPVVFCHALAWWWAVGLAVSQVEIDLHPEESRVDVTVSRQPFTSYLFGSRRSKPILFPVRAPGGRIVTRLVPIAPGEGESQDHPHQESLWLAYGDVEGLDFWSGSNGVRLRHRSIVRVAEGSTGVLEVLIDWVDSEGRRILEEIRRLEFGSGTNLFWVDHTSRLLAGEQPVRLGETKEGLFGLRVATPFRERSGRSAYLDAFGNRGEKAIWGSRGPWAALRGELEGEPLTIAIFDHPSTFNYPSYWHTRGYGLFAANPLGRKDFVEGSLPVGWEIPRGEGLSFRYRLSVYSTPVDKQRLDSEYQAYIR